MGIPGVCPPSAVPTPTETPCVMRQQNGVNVLASTADTETDGRGELAQSDAAVAALMLTQVNSFQCGGWYTLGTWAANNRTPETLVADSSHPVVARMIDIAEVMVDSYCQTNGTNPFALFDSQQYPEITAMASDQRLQALIGNCNAVNEISIDASRADQFRNDPDYPLQYVVTPPAGARRTVVIGGRDVPGAWLRYQCHADEVEVMRENPSD